MSDSSDSDGDDSDSDSDGGETQSVQSNHSVCSNEDAEGENENQLTIGKSKEVQEAEKEEIIDEGSIPVFTRHALKSSDNAPIPAELINFFAVDRDELMWQLQHDLLVQWFYVFQTQTVSSDTDREFPSAVASCLYTIVYSSDVILSTEASETLSLLYKEFSSEVCIPLDTVCMPSCLLACLFYLVKEIFILDQMITYMYTGDMWYSSHWYIHAYIIYHNKYMYITGLRVLDTLIPGITTRTQVLIPAEFCGCDTTQKLCAGIVVSRDKQLFPGNKSDTIQQEATTQCAACKQLCTCIIIFISHTSGD